MLKMKTEKKANLFSGEKMNVSIIIINYHSKHLLSTLESINKNIGLKKRDYECIVVDNGSSEQQRNILSQKQKEMSIKIILQEKNEGFACAANRGVKEANGEYVILINPDIILQKQIVPELLNFLDKNKNVGIIAPKLLNQDGSLQYSCKKYPSLFILVARRTLLKDIVWIKRKIEEYEMRSLERDAPCSVNWLCGAFLLGRKRIFETFPLDERFFLYFEDVDFCRQVHKEYDVIYYPMVSAVHYGNYGSKKNTYLFFLHFRSMIQYFLKWSLKGDDFQKYTDKYNLTFMNTEEDKLTTSNKKRVKFVQ